MKRGDNYHWTETNISDWAADRIREELEWQGHTVQRMDVSVKLCQRMNTLGLVYMISFDCAGDGEEYGMRDFYSTAEKADGMERFEWFVGFFKELEAEATLKFGSRVLDVEREIDRKCEVKRIDAPEARTVDMSCSVSINCSADEMREFVCREEYISMWSGGQAVFGVDLELENTVIRGLREENGTVRMEWRFREWKEFSDVRMTFEPVMSNTKISVVQKNVPIRETESIKMWWRERMFARISACFGFALKE